jgi:hypothetical protein
MKKEQFHKYDNEAKKYGVAISEVADWNYGCEARTFYKIKPHIASKKTENLSKYRNVTALELRDNAKQQLAEIKTIESGVEYLNKVKAIEVWAKAEKKDAELQNIVAEQKLRTQRILGGLLKEDNLNKGGNPNLSTDTTGLKVSELGITRDESSAFQRISNLPQELFEEQIRLVLEENNNQTELTTSKMLHAAKQYELDKIRNAESEKLQKHQK